MSFRNWFANLQVARNIDRLKRPWRRSPRRRQSSSFCLAAEVCEARVLLSAITVVNTSDGGAGSLRAAITQVNADTQPGIDTIDFAIGTGVQGIAPLSALPTITHSVVIDGTSQPGFAGKPLIGISGANLGLVTGILSIAASNCTVEGLNIGYFRWGNGVDVTGSFNTIGGTTPGAGNVISNNGHAGVFIHSGTGNVLEGNFIGTSAAGVIYAGLSQFANGMGVEIDGNSNIVGGTTPGARNLISGNADNGLTLKGSGNLVEGNFIGTDITGTLALPNGWATTFTSAVVISGASNTLGGTAPGDGNVISGNPGIGVLITGAGAVNNVVQGNYIGTDVTGTKALKNDWPMTIQSGANSNLIGGTTVGAGNLLVNGIRMAGVSGNVVQGNSIGTDVTGKIALDTNGLYSFSLIEGNNTIGGATPAAGNLIYLETLPGVRLLAAPVLTSAVSSNGTITISGTLNRDLNSTYSLNFFSDAAGTVLIGSGSVTTDATGKATFTMTFPGVLSPGEVITANSVDAHYNTSMLSAGLGTALVVTGFPSATTAGAASAFTVTVQNLDGSTATSHAGTVHFSSSDPRAVLPADYTFTAADQGVHAFSAILKTAGSRSLTATDTVTGRIAGSEAGIVVNPAAASLLVISAPSSVTHGVAFSLTLTVADAYGNVVTGYVGTVHFTSSDSTAALPANYTFTAGDAGVHTFVNKTTLRKRGTRSITVTDTHNSGLTASINTSVA